MEAFYGLYRSFLIEPEWEESSCQKGFFPLLLVCEPGAVLFASIKNNKGAIFMEPTMNAALDGHFEKRHPGIYPNGKAGAWLPFSHAGRAGFRHPRLHPGSSKSQSGRRRHPLTPKTTASRSCAKPSPVLNRKNTAFPMPRTRSSSRWAPRKRCSARCLAF